AAFASDLDPVSKAQLERGERLVEILKQSESSPQAVEYQMASIFLAEEGVFDVVPVEDVRRFSADVQEYLQQSPAAADEQIAGRKASSDESTEALLAAAKDFPPSFRTTEGDNWGTEAPVDPLAEEEVKKTEVTVSRKSAK